MKKKFIISVVLATPFFVYSTTLEDRIRDLEEAAYQKALELQQLSEQIRKVDSFWSHFGSCFGKELRQGVERKLKQAGIQTRVKIDHLERYSTDVEIHIKPDYPIHYRLKERPGLRNFLLADKNEKDIRKAIHQIENAITTAGNNCASALAGITPFEHDLTTELFDLDNFDLLKFFCVQSAAEMHLLKHLVVRYQKCLNELIEINNELLSLK